MSQDELTHENRHTELTEALNTAISHYEKAHQKVKETRQLRSKLQSQRIDLEQAQKNHTEPDMKALLLENDGEFNETSEQALLTNLMMERKVHAVDAALIEVEEQLLRDIIYRQQKASEYAVAYVKVAQPYIDNQINLLIDEIKTSFSARVGQVLGLEQACRMGGAMGQNKYDVPEDMTLKYRVLSEVKSIFKQDWIKHAIQQAGDNYIGELPNTVINALNNTPSPIQLKRAETDNEFRASILSQL